MGVPALPVYPPRSRGERALDLLFPPLCVGCRKVGRWICETCWCRVGWLGMDKEAPLDFRSPLARVLGVAKFEDTAREAVHALKYEERHAISGMMGRLMAGVLDEPVDVVCPVSLHPTRRRERGYDQADMLARVVARASGVRYRALLERTRRTAQQASLSGDERRSNVRGAFRARERLAGERVVLVDDVYTTGATLDAAAEALVASGAGRVLGLVFAVAERRTH